MTEIFVSGRGRLRPLQARVCGYKHATVQLMAAAVALGRKVTLHNVPRLEDTLVLEEIIRRCGGVVRSFGRSSIIDAASISKSDIPASLSKRIHGSLYLFPALLGRFGRMKLPVAGGCQLLKGEASGRPVSHMLEIMRRFGARFRVIGNSIHGEWAEKRAADIDIADFSIEKGVVTGPHVSGATKTAILASIFLNEGEVSRIRNPYMKGDVLELVGFLKHAGMRIEFSKSMITIWSLAGRPQAKARASGSLEYTVMPCVSEIMTYLMFGLYAGIPVRLTGVDERRARPCLRAELDMLGKMGVRLAWKRRRLSMQPAGPIRNLDINVTSGGIYSDHQPFFALLMLKGDRPAKISEWVWKDRFDYVKGLRKLGGTIDTVRNGIRVHPSSLYRRGKVVIARDLRSAAVLLLAAASIPGKTTLKGMDHLVRGYEDIFGILRKTGVRISHERHRRAI